MFSTLSPDKSQNTFLLLKNGVSFAPICTATSAGVCQVEFPHSPVALNLESNVSLIKEIQNQEQRYQAFPPVCKPISVFHHFFDFLSSWVSGHKVYQTIPFRNSNVSPISCIQRVMQLIPNQRDLLPNFSEAKHIPAWTQQSPVKRFVASLLVPVSPVTRYTPQRVIVKELAPDVNTSSPSVTCYKQLQLLQSQQQWLVSLLPIRHG